MKAYLRHGRFFSTLSLALTSGFLPLSLYAQEEKTPIDMNADRLEMDRKEGTLKAEGDVRIVQTGLLELRADKAEYRYLFKEIEATGHIRLVRKEDIFVSERMVFDIKNQTGTFENAQINLQGPGGIAAAKKVIFRHEEGKRDNDLFTLEESTFTNCECEIGADAPAPPWHFTAKKVEIDREENSVTARNIRLYAGGIPVFAFPWWQQPLLPKPKSGFLQPEFRSGGNGFETEVPYFWSIAPDKDATLALRSLSQRGLMAKLQYRYLGQNFKGQWDVNGLYDTDEERYRGLTVFKHDHNLGKWQLRSHLENSRTRDFINDFEQSLVDKRSRRLESSVALDRIWLRPQGYSRFQSGVRWFQDLEQGNDDYTMQSLPYILLADSRKLGTDPEENHWRLDSETRLDNFYQIVGNASQRIDVAPTIRFRTPLEMGHVSAALGVRETAYLLDGDPNQTNLDRSETLHRESAHLSLRWDGALSKVYGNAYQHTIEPRLQYVVNSSTDQSKLPNYDASLRSFTVTDIFAHNLYSGVDRISDIHWMGYGITSRLLSYDEERNTLAEKGVFTIGQRWAPQDNREYQNGHAFSSVATRLEVNVSDHLSFVNTVGYDPYQKEIESLDSLLSIQWANGMNTTNTPERWDGGLTLGHHFNNPELSGQVEVDPSSLTTLFGLQENSREKVNDLSLDGSLRLSDHWLWKQQTDYSLTSNEFKSWKTGLTYEHQCWSFELTAGRDLATSTSQHGGGFIGFFINLQGLGGVGI